MRGSVYGSLLSLQFAEHLLLLLGRHGLEYEHRLIANVILKKCHMREGRDRDELSRCHIVRGEERPMLQSIEIEVQMGGEVSDSNSLNNEKLLYHDLQSTKGKRIWA